MRSDLIYCITRRLLNDLKYNQGDFGKELTAGDKVVKMLGLIYSVPGETLLLPISLVLSLVLKSEESRT